MRILQRIGGVHFSGGPFTATIQLRFKKPANTAQTRLEIRTHDPKLDLLAFHRRRVALILNLYNLIRDKKRGPFISLQLLSRWAPHASVKSISGGKFVRKYPHVFEVFTHPVRRNLCCRFTAKFVNLIGREQQVTHEMEEANVIKIRRVLSLSVNGTIHIHSIRLIRRELGLPEDFVDSIIRKHCEYFRFIDSEIIELLSSSSETFTAQVEKWREKEYTDKWLSEFETKYAFPINFPTGFRLVPGSKEKLKNWQRLQYLKPYQRIDKVTPRTCGGIGRYEKRAVGVIHELLCLTVEKVVEVERFAHFRRDLGFHHVNVRELLLKHPGIFYLSQRGNTLYVFLREAYQKGTLVEPDEIYQVRWEMLELVRLGRRCTKMLGAQEESELEEDDLDIAESSKNTHANGSNK